MSAGSRQALGRRTAQSPEHPASGASRAGRPCRLRRRGALRPALGLALALPLTLAPISAAPLPTPFALRAAHADDACGPGTSAELPGPPAGLAQLGLFPEESRPTGAGITVAIVDSGIDATRPQLAAAIAPGSTSLIADGEPGDGLSDPHGHGTALAGIIAARAESGSGVIGIAPEAGLISIRVFRGDDEQARKAGLGPDTERISAGIRAGADAGAQIIVIAISDDVGAPALEAATGYAHAHGALVVASAGNRNTTENTADTPRYPAAYAGALAVTAVNALGEATDDSIHGAHIDVAAPGQQVLTTATGAGDCLYALDAPSASFATAYAAGVAALIAETYPEEGPDGWAYRLEASAQRPDPDARDDRIGWGLVRPMDALALRPDSSTRGPASPFADTAGSAVPRPAVQIEATRPETHDTTPVIVVAAGAAALLAALAIGARLRRRRE